MNQNINCKNIVSLNLDVMLIPVILPCAVMKEILSSISCIIEVPYVKEISDFVEYTKENAISGICGDENFSDEEL